MTRYGFAIKALPKPFETEDDEDEESEEGKPGSPSDSPQPFEEAASEPAPSSAPPTGPADPPKDDPAQPPVEEAAAPPADDAAEAPPPADDARPWSGDMYDEGDESDPASAFAAYTGSTGEEAWLDQAPDGTLTGWVRDSTGQVWRYADADAWAIDVDDAQMNRSHGGGETADAGIAPADDPGKQDPLFPPQ